MKQTAVEWLVEQLKENNRLTFDEWTEIINQAEAMEKEQIKDAYNVGNDEYDIYRNGQNYYNETFKSE